MMICPGSSRIANVFRGRSPEPRDRRRAPVAPRRSHRARSRSRRGPPRLRLRCSDRAKRAATSACAAWLDSLRADAVFGWRQLMKRKVTSAAAILSLALAIGACTAAFRLIDALLLRPLPVAHPERLYVCTAPGHRIPTASPRQSTVGRILLFQLMRAAVKDQAELIAVSYAERDGPDLQVRTRRWRRRIVQYVSGWMFASFGLRPALGRLFTENDDLKPGAHPVRRALLRLLDAPLRARSESDRPHVSHGRARSIRSSASVRRWFHRHRDRHRHRHLCAHHDASLRHSDRLHAGSALSCMLKPGVAVEPVRAKLRATSRAFEQERAKGVHGHDQAKLSIDSSNQTVLLEPAASGASGMQKDYRQRADRPRRPGRPWCC